MLKSSDYNFTCPECGEEFLLYGTMEPLRVTEWDVLDCECSCPCGAEFILSLSVVGVEVLKEMDGEEEEDED